MLRVGYPAVFSADLFADFPSGIELVPVSEDTDGQIDIDVWIPDPYSNRALRTWPHLRGVRLVLALMAGTEWIPAVVGPHVTICNAHGAHNIATAEWTVSAILAMFKHFPFYIQVQKENAWKRRFDASANYAKLSGDTRPLYPPVLVEELTNKRVLLVGYGEIGKEIERMLEPFRVRMTRVARSARNQPPVRAVAELDALLPEADVVILILPLNESSLGLMDARRLALMPQGALLVNAARGPIVNTAALMEALKAGKIRAALDVTDPEPLPEGHALWNCPNLLLTPHVAGSTPEFAPRALGTAAGELRRYLAGEQLHNVVQAAV